MGGSGSEVRGGPEALGGDLSFSSEHLLLKQIAFTFKNELV